MKRLGAFLCGLLLVLCAAGCGKTDGNTPEDEEAPEAANRPYCEIQVYSTAYAWDMSRELRTMYAPYTGWEAVEAAVNQYLGEKLNAHISYILPTGGVNPPSPRDDLLTRLSAGEKLDLVFTDGISGDISSCWAETVSRGSWKALDALLPACCPGLWSRYSTDLWDACRYNGSIYGVPGWTAFVPQTEGAAYRLDWAEEAGLEGIASYADLEKYMEKVTEAGHAVLGGNAGTALWSLYLATHGGETLLPVENGLQMGIMGTSPQEWWTAVDILSLPAFEDYAEQATVWRQAGYWQSDSVSYSTEVAASIFAGDCAMAATSAEQFAGLVEINGKNAAIWPGSYKNRAETGELGYTDLREGSKSSLSVLKGCALLPATGENTERALMLLNLLASDDAFSGLLSDGIEGTHYTLTEGIQTALHMEQKDVFFISPVYHSGFQSLTYPTAGDWAGQKGFLDTQALVTAPNPSSGFHFNGETVIDTWSQLLQLEHTMLPAVLYGLTDTPKAALDAYMAERENAGFSSYFAEYQRQLTQYHLDKEGGA